MLICCSLLVKAYGTKTQAEAQARDNLSIISFLFFCLYIFALLRSAYITARDKHNHKRQNHRSLCGTSLFPPLSDFGLDSSYKSPWHQHQYRQNLILLRLFVVSFVYAYAYHSCRHRCDLIAFACFPSYLRTNFLAGLICDDAGPLLLLESGIQGFGIWDPVSTDTSPESSTWNPESKTVLDSFTWGDSQYNSRNAKMHHTLSVASSTFYCICSSFVKHESLTHFYFVYYKAMAPKRRSYWPQLSYAERNFTKMNF